MKKRLIILVLLILLMPQLFNVSKKVKAEGEADYSNYETFSYMQFSKGKLLRNYSDEELSPHIKSTYKRRFRGWRIAYINYHVRCNFVSKTILSIVNTGSSAIEYEVEKTETTMNKVSVNVNGSLKGGAKGTKIKGNLDASLGISKEREESVSCKTSESLKITVDPNTKVTVSLKGSGYLTNGYALYYDFWLKSYRGCFEYFELVDVYPKILKESI